MVFFLFHRPFMNPPDLLLNEEQLVILMHLYKKRLRVFLAGFIGVFLILFRISFNHFLAWYYIHYEFGIQYVEKEKLERINWSVFFMILFMGAFFCYFVYYFFTRIAPLAKDIKLKIGTYVPLEITQKSIPYHNRCFMFLHSLKVPYIEVDYATYFHYQIGDEINILFGKYSKIHIDEYLNMPLL